jgi:hypothetical protein
VETRFECWVSGAESRAATSKPLRLRCDEVGDFGLGPAVVWPYIDRYGNTRIRCFIPGGGVGRPGRLATRDLAAFRPAASRRRYAKPIIRPACSLRCDYSAVPLAPRAVALVRITGCGDDLPANHCNGQFRADGK